MTAPNQEIGTLREAIARTQAAQDAAREAATLIAQERANAESETDSEESEQ